MEVPQCRDLLARRCQPEPVGRWDVRSRLAHFALVNYALPKKRLVPHIPQDRFEIPEFEIGGRRLAMMSAVPFLDLDFHFPRLAPFAKFRFAQTNYRVYVNDRRTGEPCVWFFGTTLGSHTVSIPRWLWRLPWHHARYHLDCAYDAAAGRYQRYHLTADSAWAPAEIELEDTGIPVTTCEGFGSAEEAALVLTHPVDGYFRRQDGQLGHYAVWHERMRCTLARPRRLNFGLFERLNLLSQDEMSRPHSVFLCPEIEFLIHLPPHQVD
ncbi:MAG: DUF2071 domain-containing protein [Proteobacteria bacterium]|nr:DUF2071 domain-containing protein [Pseudomonadota bacterium]